MVCAQLARQHSTANQPGNQGTRPEGRVDGGEIPTVKGRRKGSVRGNRKWESWNWNGVFLADLKCGTQQFASGKYHLGGIG